MVPVNVFVGSITFACCNNQFLIYRDLLKQRHAKLKEKFIARRFGVAMTPLSRAIKV